VTRKDFFREFLSSIVVFFIALPLCLGIAIACGVPPALGLVTGIVGGLVVGTLSGAPLQVSGPAAGLTVLVYDLVEHHGLSELGSVVLLAGMLQALAGLFKLGRWFRAISPAVMHGMLAAIGILIMASQFHVMFDVKPHGSGLPNILSIPPMVVHALAGQGNYLAALTGIFTWLTLAIWKNSGLEKLTHIPAPLPAIIAASAMAAYFQLPIAHVVIPENLAATLTLPNLDTLYNLMDAQYLVPALGLALIASAETLLSAGAVDQLHQGTRANYNKELLAQGLGNMVCGTLGSLPLTGVIVRSKVNVEAGAKTRWSAVMHGAWLLLAVCLLPWMLEMIPTSALAALLVATGYKLVDREVIAKLRSYGKTELGIYGTTVAVIVATDLLTGVLVGMSLSLMKLVWKMAQLQVVVGTPDQTGVLTLTMRGSATMLGLPILAEKLEAIPAGSTLHINADKLLHIDHACMELLRNWETRHRDTGGTLLVDWNLLDTRYRSPYMST